MSEDRLSNEKNHLDGDTEALQDTQTEWFIDINGEQHGPVTEEQVVELVNSGQLGPQHYVWRDGLEDWVRLQDVSNQEDPTEQLQSALKNLPLSEGSDLPDESVPQPDEINSSSSQNEIDSNLDEQNIGDASGEDSSSLAPPDTEEPERQNDELSAEQENDSATEDLSEPVVGENQDTLQSQSAEDPIPQDSDGQSEDVQGEVSYAKDQGVLENPGSFEVPRDNAFTPDSEAKPFDDSYSLHYLVTSALQKRTVEQPRTVDGYASEDNSGLIDLGKLNQIEAGPSSMNGPDRVKPQFRAKFDSLIPTERLVPVETNRPIKLAAASGIGIIALAAAASFLILNYRQPVQDTVASTSVVTDVSQRELQHPIAERKGEQRAIQPPKAASSTAIPEIKSDPVQKDRISTNPVVTAVKKKSRVAANDGAAASKKTKPNRKEEISKKQTPIRTRSTSKDKSEASTDELLDWAVGKGDKTPTPAATEAKSPSTPQPKPEAKQPEQPSREQTLAAMRKITPAVKACSGKKGDVATAAITVEGRSGTVKQATITGVDATVSKCIKKAVSRARFPRFSKTQFDIKYPFRL